MTTKLAAVARATAGTLGSTRALAVLRCVLPRGRRHALETAGCVGQRRLRRKPAAPAVAAVVCMNILFAACDGGPLGPGLGSPIVITEGRTTVTITGTGLNPQVVGEAATCRSSNCLFYVKFVNEDTVPHDLQSDPHPDHSTCVRFNTEVGRIGPGESREIIANGCDFSRFRGYHDETRPDDPRFHGQIVP
jgi:hypothetical protein